jgi:hypothetical protein
MYAEVGFMREGEDALARAEKLLSHKQYRAVVDLLSPWVRKHPDDARAWELLATAYLKLQDWPRAEQAAGQVVRLRPNSPRAWSNWGAMLRRLGGVHEAARAQRKALEIELGHARPHTSTSSVKASSTGSAQEAPAQADERVLFSRYRATVTGRLVSIEGGPVFSVADITSVHIREHRVPADETGPSVAAGVGAAMVLSALVNLMPPVLASDSPDEAPEQPMALAVVACLLLPVGAIPLIWGVVGLRRVKRPPPVYVLTLVCGRQEVEAYRSHDRHFIGELGWAVRQAVRLRRTWRRTHGSEGGGTGS